MAYHVLIIFSSADFHTRSWRRKWWRYTNGRQHFYSAFLNVTPLDIFQQIWGNFQPFCDNQNHLFLTEGQTNSNCVGGDKNVIFKPNLDLFLTLTKCSLYLNQQSINRMLSQERSRTLNFAETH